MKKILSAILVLVITSCSGGITYRVKVQKGDVRKTYTQEYVITEVCDGVNGFGNPFWEKVSVEKRSIEVESNDN